MNKKDLLASLPAEWPQDLLPQIQEQIKTNQVKVVVLDDDPTGTQTVHGVGVLTTWSVDTLAAELADPDPVFYLLTNSRSLPLAEAEKLNVEIGRNLASASQQIGRDFAVVSRSDSTLRGHFPEEVQALADSVAQDFDAWLVIPFFLEGGRYTIGDVHYVAEDESLVPAGQTEFARDAAFGYQASDLREWVLEKTRGRVSAEAVSSISLEDIRRGDPQTVADRLSKLAQGSVCVVNAVSYRDLEVFTLGLLIAEAQRRRFLYRTAASFVRVRAGITPRALLTRSDLGLSASGAGLFIVGSHVPRTTRQLNALLDHPSISSVEVNVESLLSDARRSDEIDNAVKQIDQHLLAGRDTVVFTSRELITGTDAEGSLSFGQSISSGLVAIVRGIATRPRYLVAKGGITSSDIATDGLGVRRALVRGQILPGVPLWELGSESRHPGMAYIVFPGNVGDTEALVEIATTLKE
ncbi:MAG: hypothetical protein JSV03_01965 [Planctomycetota bacterium]|nr:MAG: hypothetical protein JSV03_01965 [Planctomycetota bacterium]